MSSVANFLANLALALAKTSPNAGRARVGLLDLDIFGPSVPMLMGLDKAGEPDLNECKLQQKQLPVPKSVLAPDSLS